MVLLRVAVLLRVGVLDPLGVRVGVLDPLAVREGVILGVPGCVGEGVPVPAGLNDPVCVAVGTGVPVVAGVSDEAGVPVEAGVPTGVPVTAADTLPLGVLVDRAVCEADGVDPEVRVAEPVRLSVRGGVCVEAAVPETELVWLADAEAELETEAVRLCVATGVDTGVEGGVAVEEIDAEEETMLVSVGSAVRVEVFVAD